MNITATCAILVLTLILAALDGAQACYIPADAADTPPAQPKEMSLPSPLAGGDWRVDTIDGAPLPDGIYPILSFSADGQITGTLGCKSVIATYGGDTERLDIGTLFLTRAPCPPVAEAVEADLQAILRGRLSLPQPDDSAWVMDLTSTDGRTIRLGRVVYR